MSHRSRLVLIIVVLLVCVAGLFFRMFTLSILDRGFLLMQSRSRIIRTVDIPAHRGMITDRNGVPVAVSAPVDSIWANPQLLRATAKQVAELSTILGISEEELKHKLDPKSDREFIYLGRELPPETADQIKALKINSIFFQREYRRFYPSGAAMAHVLGITNIDDNGQEGLELAYNEWLRGVSGKRQVVKDRLGQVVSNLEVVRSPQEGHDLVLSVDSRIQYLAYTTLQETAPKYNAESGSIVVLDVTNGEILAMANIPSYNPNIRSGHSQNYRNRAATDVFEPGSTMKAFSVASALFSGKYFPTTEVDTRPGKMEIHGYTIKDDDNYGVINLVQILQKSSNIGAAKITLSLPPDNLWNFLVKMGFGQSTESGFPGESSGVLVRSHFNHDTNLATMAYGYGLSVTALQLVRAYGILAAQGEKRPITFLKGRKAVASEPVIDPKLAKQMLGLLQAVTEGGDLTSARIAGYHVGGKTGTAYTAGKGGYEKDRYTSSFIGVAPIGNPRLVVAVILHGVHGNIHFGAQVSAPAFAEVMSGALRYLNVPPDR